MAQHTSFPVVGWARTIFLFQLVSWESFFSASNYRPSIPNFVRQEISTEHWGKSIVLLCRLFTALGSVSLTVQWHAQSDLQDNGSSWVPGMHNALAEHLVPLRRQVLCDFQTGHTVSQTHTYTSALFRCQKFRSLDHRTTFPRRQGTSNVSP